MVRHVVREGSEPLPNKNHELFACEIAIAGMTQEAAYQSIYGNRKSARQNASRLMTNANIQRRLSYLRGRAIKRAQISIDDALQRLAEYAFASLGKYLRVDENGRLYHDFSEASQSELVVIGELATETVDVKGKPLVTRQRVKLVDPLKALDILLKYLRAGQQAAPGGFGPGAVEAEFEEVPADQKLLLEWAGWLDMQMQIYEIDEEVRDNILKPLRNAALPAHEEGT